MKDRTIKYFFRLIFKKAVIAQDIYKTDKISDDPADNHLLELKHYYGIQIVNAKTFIKCREKIIRMRKVFECRFQPHWVFRCWSLSPFTGSTQVRPNNVPKHIDG